MLLGEVLLEPLTACKGVFQLLPFDDVFDLIIGCRGIVRSWLGDDSLFVGACAGCWGGRCYGSGLGVCGSTLLRIGKITNGGWEGIG